MNTNKPRYERVGWPREKLNVNRYIEALQDSLEGEDRLDLVKTRRSDPVRKGRFIVIQYYLLEDIVSARSWAQKVIGYADEYFFGDWRDRIPSGNYRDQSADRSYWDKYAPWKLEFEASLLCGSCLGEWERLARYGDYLRDDVIRDAEQSPENWAWLLTIAGMIRGQSLGDRNEFVDKVRNGRRKREKLLLAWLTAIEAGTDEEVADAAKEYFKHYKRSESRTMELTSKVTIDGTFLVHYARHRGRSIDIPSSVQDHILELELSEAPS